MYYQNNKIKLNEWEPGDWYEQRNVTFDLNGNFKKIVFNKMMLEGKKYYKIPNYQKENITEWSYYDNNGQYGGKEIVKPISSNEKEFELCDYEGELIHKGISIFKNNKIIKRTYTYDRYNNNVDTEEFEYDKNNNLINQKITDNIETLIYNYEYLDFDDKGNWTKSIFFEGDDKEDCHMIIREIKYYTEEEILSSNSNKTNNSKKINQENAENTIKQFVSTNSFGSGNNLGVSGSFNENSINSIEQISQFTETEASSIVHFNYKDAFANENLILKFNFKRDINKYWFLTSIEAVSGVGSQKMSDNINKWRILNVPVQ